MKHYIGLDAHHTTSTFTVLNPRGDVTQQAEVQTTETHLLGFLRSISGSKHLAFEESQLAQWLYELLHGEVKELVICHPGFVRKRSGTKTDALDAHHLAQELRRGHLVSVFHASSSLMNLRTLVTGYLRWVEDIVRLKNRYKALFIQAGRPVRGSGSFYTQAQRIKELSNPSARFVAQQLFDHIQFLEQEKKKTQKRFQAFKRQNWMVRYLCDLPGIEAIRACVIASFVTSPHRFATKHRFWAYAMLVHHPKISAGKVFGQAMIQGRRELKSAFIGAAESCLLHSNEFRLYFDSLIARGMKRNHARNAVARKLAAISLAMLKHKTRYQPQRIQEVMTEVTKDRTVSESQLSV